MSLDYSLVASGILFLACKAMEYTINPKIIEQARSVLNTVPIKEFGNCVKKMRAAWHQMKTTTTYANFDSVYNKYTTVSSFVAKNINVPTYNQQDLDEWFYTE